MLVRIGNGTIDVGGVHNCGNDKLDKLFSAGGRAQKIGGSGCARGKAEGGLELTLIPPHRSGIHFYHRFSAWAKHATTLPEVPRCRTWHSFFASSSRLSRQHGPVLPIDPRGTLQVPSRQGQHSRLIGHSHSSVWPAFHTQTRCAPPVTQSLGLCGANQGDFVFVEEHRHTGFGTIAPSHGF